MSGDAAGEGSRGTDAETGSANDSNRLFPNRGERGDDEGAVSRRGLLAGSAAAGAALAGCSGDGGATETPDAEVADRETVFVFNTGDDTVSVVDVATDEVVGTTHLGLSASFPSNQYAPELTDEAADPLWLNVDSGVRALAVGSLSEVATVDTGSGLNWQELTPDGGSLVVSAREPAHTNYLIDADRDSGTFGEVTAQLDRTEEGGAGDEDGPGPCDVTVHPDGEYAYVPDIWGGTLTVLDLGEFEIESQIDVPAPEGADAAEPWMGTLAPSGDRLLVEHRPGVETVWDTSDPADPEEIARLTPEDGLGDGPLTSEVGPDSEVGYVFTPGSEDVTVVDIPAGEVSGRIPLDGQAFVGTWGPSRETLYVPVQTNDEVAVIDHGRREIAARLDVGTAPYGATAATVQPAVDDSPSIAAAMAAAGLDLSESGTTYCIGNCACGHDPEL